MPLRRDDVACAARSTRRRIPSLSPATSVSTCSPQRAQSPRPRRALPYRAPTGEARKTGARPRIRGGSLRMAGVAPESRRSSLVTRRQHDDEKRVNRRAGQLRARVDCSKALRQCRGVLAGYMARPASWRCAPGGRTGQRLLAAVGRSKRQRETRDAETTDPRDRALPKPASSPSAETRSLARSDRIMRGTTQLETARNHPRRP